MTHKIGVIYNPNSGGGKNPLHKKLRHARNAANVIFIETHERSDISPALSQIAMRGATYLAIIGGDGTVDAVLTSLRKHNPFKEEPTIVVFDGGTTNMSYLDIGFKFSSAARKADNPLEEVLKLANDGKVKTIKRAPIEVSSQSLNAPLLGFFLGTNAIPRAISHTREHFHSKGMTNVFGQAIATAGMIWRLLRGKPHKDPVLTPTRTVIEHDGNTRTTDAVFLTLTSLNKLILGIRPVTEGEGGIAMMGVTSPYSRFIRHLPTLLSGKRTLEPQNDDGCLNVRTTGCVLTFEGEWTLDGELFKAYEHMPITIKTAEPFTFAVGAKA